MGYFYCPVCDEWWGSWTPESVAQHNAKHENVIAGKEEKGEGKPPSYIYDEAPIERDQ